MQMTQKTYIIAKENDSRPYRQVVLEGTPEKVKQDWMRWHPRGRVLRIVKEDKTWWLVKAPMIQHGD